MNRRVRSLLLAALAALAANTLDAQTAHIRFGEVAGQPGEIVAIPVCVTIDMTMIGAWMAFTFDPAAVEPLSYEVKDTAAAGANPYAPFLILYGEQGYCGIGTRQRGSSPNSGSMQVPPGENVLIGKLMVRIRANAPVGETPVVATDRFQRSDTVLFFGGGVRAGSITYEGGKVAVLAPVGPRPVGNLACTQFLDRAVLSYTLTETYDSIEIRRNGSPFATIPGTQAEYSDPIAETGPCDYAVVAVRGGTPSIPATCQLIATTPSAPGVTELACDGQGLQWKNPVAFDRISVFRDGEQIAELPGTATSYVDPNRPPNVTVYGIVSELSGFVSPDVTCVDNGIWVLEIPDVQVPVDAAEVRIPVYATTAKLVLGFSIALDIDQTRFKLIQSDPDASIAETTLYPEPDWLVVNVNSLTGLPTISVIFDMTPSLKEFYKFLAPGLRQNIANFFFEPTGVFSAGDAYPVSIHQREGVLTAIEGLDAYRAPISFMLGGEIRFGSGGVKAVDDLQATTGHAKAGTYTVSLSWANQAAYDAVRIERNGERIADLAGTATAYEDGGLDASVYTYKVIATRGGETSFPADVFVSTVANTRTFLRGDVNRDLRLNIGDPIYLLLHLLGRGDALPCEDAADANDDGVLTIADPIFILAYLFRGDVALKSPGATYPWFDPTPDTLTCKQ